MYASSMHGNREIPEAAGEVPASVRSGKAAGPTPDMHATGKSDEDIVSMKQSNNGAQPGSPGHPPAETVERRSSAKGNPTQPTATGTQRPAAASNGLGRVREAAKRDKRQRFTNLMHHVTVDLLRRAYEALKRDAAAGVDGVTWWQYGEQLEERLAELHDRVQSGRYRARPSKRAWLRKPDGRRRPLGIAVVEDKIVQQALVWVLEAIYEVDFMGFSYGVRPGRSPHQALDAIYVAITQRKVNWLLDADFRSFFDTLDQRWLGRFLEHRVADPRMLRLIGKFLRAGVSEDGEWSKTVVGTPQGAVMTAWTQKTTSSLWSLLRTGGKRKGLDRCRMEL